MRKNDKYYTRESQRGKRESLRRKRKGSSEGIQKEKKARVLRKMKVYKLDKYIDTYLAN